MAEDRLTVDYRQGEVRALAHVHLADDEPRRDLRGSPRRRGEVHRLQLRSSDVRSKTAFERLIERNARASNELWFWCGREVWLRLLELLDLRPPIPDQVRWPSGT
jgi:hypothetical protein